MIAALLAAPWIKAAGEFLRGIPREVWYVLILAIAGWWAYGTIYERGARSRDVEIAILQTQLQSAQAANADNMEAIAKLTAANTQWAESAKVQQKQAAEAVAAVAKERDALAQELRERRKQRQVIYEQNQDAADWGRTRIPDSVTEQLRE